MTKKIKRIISIALAGVCTTLVVVMAIVTNGFGMGGSSAPLEQFNHNNQISFENFSGSGIMLTASANELSEPAANAETAENTVRLTATVTPSTASIQSVDWTVAWVNASSEWATGKKVTDYVTVTPTADGALTADVNCLQAFGEQVKVTVVSRDISSITADCTIDYGQKVLSGTFSLFSGDTVSHSTEADRLTVNADFSVFLRVEFNEVVNSECTLLNTSGSLNVLFDFASDIDEKLAAINEEMGTDIKRSTTSPGIQSSTPAANLNGKNFISFFTREGGGSFFSDDGPETLAKFQRYFYLHPDVSLGSIEITLKGTYSTFIRSIPLYFNPDYLYEAAESVALDQSSFVF